MIMMNNCNADLEKVCRSCMSVCSEMRSIFDKEVSNGHPVQLSDMIMACSEVKIKEDDGLPSHLCSECEVKLQTAFTFKKQCENSDVILRALSLETRAKVDIKQECLTLGKVVIKEECLDNLDVVIKSDISNDCTKYDDNNFPDPVYGNESNVAKGKHDSKQDENNISNNCTTFEDNSFLCLSYGNENKVTKGDSQQDKNDLTCTYCYKSFHAKKGLNIHMRRHTGEKLSTCEICSASFTRTDHLVRHMRVHKIEENKKHTCVNCGAAFAKSYQLTKHKKQHMSATNQEEFDNEDKQNMSNNVCPDHENEKGNEEERSSPNVPYENNMDFLSNNKLTSSVLTHKCTPCDKAFSREEHLTEHNDEYHLEESYVCAVCNKNFTRCELLIRHLRLHKTGIDKSILRCSICEKVSDSFDHFVRHMKVHMQQDKRYVCSECGKAYTRLDNLKTHQRIHSDAKVNPELHLCIYCGKEFNNSSNMMVHIRRHTGDLPYKCSHCEKRFPRSHDLKCHERVHSGEKPYLCTLCGKSFNRSNKLLRHSRVHTGERPYVCSICSRGFTQSNDLAAHMRRHTGTCPHVCGVCPARFIQSEQLKNHRRKTGHWMETQPELKGIHRVEPVTPVTKPVPIRFKTHGINNVVERIVKEDLEPHIMNHTVVNIAMKNLETETKTNCTTE